MPLSTFLDGQNPSQLRGAAWLALSDVGVLQTRAGTSDSGGGVTVAWTNGGTTACRIDPLTGRSGIVGGRIDERSTHRVTAPAGFSVSEADRFAITGRGTFEVTAAGERTAEWTNTFEVLEIS